MRGRDLGGGGRVVRDLREKRREEVARGLRTGCVRASAGSAPAAAIVARRCAREGRAASARARARTGTTSEELESVISKREDVLL